MKRCLALVAGIILLTSVVHAEEKLVLDLAGSIELAFKNNPQVVNAELDIRMAKASLVASKGSFLPSLEMRLGQNRQGTSAPVMSKTQGLVNTNRSYSMDTNVSWNLFNGGRNLSTLKADRISRQMAELNYERERQNTALRVAERYLACLKAKKTVEISRQALERSKAQLERTETLFQVGSVSQADVMGQKVQLGTERLKLIRAQTDHRETVADLLYLLGIGPQDQEPELRDVRMDLAYQDVGFEQTFQSALENRRDFSALQKSVQVIQYDLAASKSALLPSLNAYVNYGMWDVAVPKSFKSLSKIDNVSYGLTLSIPIFDRFQYRADIEKMRLNYRRLETELEDGKRKIALEVNSALELLKMTRESIVVAGENVESARENLRLAEERYRLGSGILLDQITASVLLREAEVDYVSAQYDHMLAQMRLKNSMGTMDR